MSYIGFFGLTGNPPHFSHCHVIREAIKQCNIVYISLVYKHPFGKSFIDYHHRQKMLDIILKEYLSPEELKKIKILEIDKEYCEKTRQVPYSYNLLNVLKETEPDNQFSLVIGEDNYHPETWKRFYKYNEIEREFSMIIIPEHELHSTQIRELMKNKEINEEVIIKSCGNDVFQYMKNNYLY